MKNLVFATTVAVGKDPSGAAPTPDGRYVYAGNPGDNTVSVISIACDRNCR